MPGPRLVSSINVGSIEMVSKLSRTLSRRPSEVSWKWPGKRGGLASRNPDSLQCLQVTDCRRILKWTYAYGFYHFGDEGGVDIVPLTTEQQAFFEFQQVRIPSERSASA